MTGINPPVVTVSQVNRVVGMIINGDKRLMNVAVRGEISNFTRHYKTGHLYFTLKDEQTQLRAVMFAGSAAHLEFDPRDGDKVVCFGAITVYEAGGVYQVKCTDMQPDGAGEQARALEELRRRLEAEGLFSQKRSLPTMPKCVAVVTSAGAAALQDVLNIISRRFPIARVIVIPAKVQGEDADVSIAAAIGRAQQTDADVLIFGRGGGSAEDLSAFNSELVVRAVYASRIPTISAVGHQTDVTLADFAADRRAPTPSAAAELAVPEAGTIISALEGNLSQIRRNAERRLAECSRELDSRMAVITALSPRNRLNNSEQRLDELSARISSLIREEINRKERALAANAEIISALNPLGVLARGYSLTSCGDRIITSAAQLKPGDEINIRLSDGVVNASVREVTGQ